MQDGNKELSKKIESGEYFQDAMRWYHNIYHSPLAERFFCVLIAVISLVTIYLNTQAFFGVYNNLAPRVALVLRSEWKENEIPKLKRLATSAETPDEALVRYFLNEYVTKREGYDISVLRSHYQRVQAMTVDEEVQRFRSHIDLQNPESPIVLYERHTNRVITILSTDFDTVLNRELEGNAQELWARIVFQADLNRGAQSLESSLWVATVAFTYKSLKVDQDDYSISPMEFVVREYSVEPLPSG